ncbi:GntR family transcriptional regulator [Clostridium aestuarii]|uniref:GntR family transcriptional regulator n=1 Tax=Clostridium aestuarii TaxID=338193 RepID=A0ABT4D4U6_9CLOT|nr:TrkA C-terminal domain-containing protein [Clostridium aestuarii]MCY6485240.1 GntR family transcriptional regulator [Clostridium aestuarii]
MEKKGTPRYIKIAIDIAHRIYNNEFKVGEKLRGRSTLSSKYNVSPETIRRSVSLLQDMDAVEVSEKSGIYVKSAENAYLFIQRFNAKNNVKQIRQKIKELQKEKLSIEKELNKNLDMLLEYSIQFDTESLKDSYEIKVAENSNIIDKTIADTQFWKFTNATIISVKRGEKMYISPGPYFTFTAEDIINFICSEDNVSKVKSYIEDSVN